MADHEHRAYDVWDGASKSDVDRLESLIVGLREDLREAEQRIAELEAVSRGVQ
jgi:hypothetical protein